MQRFTHQLCLKAVQRGMGRGEEKKKIGEELGQEIYSFNGYIFTILFSDSYKALNLYHLKIFWLFCCQTWNIIHLGC